jgi:hypothetical protein
LLFVLIDGALAQVAGIRVIRFICGSFYRSAAPLEASLCN